MAKEIELTEELKSILKVLNKESEPLGGKDIEAKTGLSGSQVPGRIKKLKDAGLVDSPVRCKYAITEAGRKKL
jgi:Mn-dependent DtxR family transcriptional regulator